MYSLILSITTFLSCLSRKSILASPYQYSPCYYTVKIKICTFQARVKKAVISFFK